MIIINNIKVKLKI